MPLKLIATDMDGTLLTDTDKSFDRDLFDRLLDDMAELDIRFVIASGNQYQKLRQYMEGFHGRGITYIAENGAYIANDSGDLLISGFTRHTVDAVVDSLSSLPEIGYLLSAHGGAYLPQDRSEPITRIIRDHLDFMGADSSQNLDYSSFINRFYPGVKVIDSPQDIGDDTVVKVAVQTRRRDLETTLEKLVDILPSNVVPVASGFGAIDLISRGVNKGSALTWFGNQEGIAAEDMLAFGDNSNDLEMLRLVGEGVAMENATPQVKAAADTVIGSNSEGAVLTYIEKKLAQLKAH